MKRPGTKIKLRLTEDYAQAAQPTFHPGCANESHSTGRKTQNNPGGRMKAQCSEMPAAALKNLPLRMSASATPAIGDSRRPAADSTPPMKLRR
jgi:hypothetical protein